MKQPNLRKHIAVIMAIGTLLFAQAAAAMIACHGGFTPDRTNAGMQNPCPMTQDAPAPLCAQKCDPDENQGRATDTLSLAPCDMTMAPVSVDCLTGSVPRLTRPGLDRETGPPLYIVFLHLLIP